MENGNGITMGVFLDWCELGDVDAMAAEVGVPPLEAGAVVAVGIQGELGIYDATAIGEACLRRMAD